MLYTSQTHTPEGESPMKMRMVAAALLVLCTMMFSASHAHAKENHVRVQASLKDTSDGGYTQVGAAMNEFHAALAKYQAQGCTLKDPARLSLSSENVALEATLVCP